METEHVNRDAAENGKRELASYPYLSLASALKISDSIKDLGGARVQIRKSVLASHLKEAEKSAALQQRIAAARSFGLIEGRSAYALTDIAKRYYFPTTEGEKALALAESLASPSAFRELIARFDGGRIPTREIIANILHRELNVPDSWKERVASFFVNSAELAGVLDEGDFLRFRAKKEGLLSKVDAGVGLTPMENHTEVPTALLSTSTPKNYADDRADFNVWDFSLSGQIIKLITPTNLDKSLWDKLNGYVQLLKPKEK